MRRFFVLPIFIFLAVFLVGTVRAQTPRDEALFDEASEEAVLATDSAEATGSAALATPAPSPVPRLDITQTTEETIGPLEKLLGEQDLGAVLPFNPLKYAIRASVGAGVPPNTLIFLLLLPLIVALIAAARHVIGLRGFGIFLPAALAIVFVAIGPIIGIILFMVIVLISTFARILLRKAKIKLQYLPRMALILWGVVIGVIGVLFLAPFIKRPDFANISIFPVLILVLLAEDFSKVQLGKSARTAINLATETIVMALVSYLLLTLESLQTFALLYPEALLLLIIIFDVLMGKYTGLRVVEYWRYRQLILKEK